MSGGLFSNIVAWLKGDDRGEQDDEDDSEFMPSQMDASVNAAHGMDTRQAQKEVQELQEQADELEANRPEEFDPPD